MLSGKAGLNQSTANNRQGLVIRDPVSYKLSTFASIAIGCDPVDLLDTSTIKILMVMGL
jgi:hypothetical protein